MWLHLGIWPNMGLRALSSTPQVDRYLPSVLPPFLALPSLFSLLLLNQKCATSSLCPLTACVSLTVPHTDHPISEQDAQVISGLAKLEKLRNTMASEACRDSNGYVQRIASWIWKQCDAQALLASRRHWRSSLCRMFLAHAHKPLCWQSLTSQGSVVSFVVG